MLAYKHKSDDNRHASHIEASKCRQAALSQSLIHAFYLAVFNTEAGVFF